MPWYARPVPLEAKAGAPPEQAREGAWNGSSRLGATYVHDLNACKPSSAGAVLTFRNRRQ